MKKIVCAFAVILLALAGCANEATPGALPEADASEQVAVPEVPPQIETDEGDADTQDANDGDPNDAPFGSAFFDKFTERAVLLQFEPLTPGEELVVLHTNHGDITLRLFPDEAPLSVENFLTHARNGYYDGVIFHRVINDFMIQGGDPTGTGAGGESIWGEPFFIKPMGMYFFGDTYEDDRIYELPSINLKHFRGALAMAHAGGSMGSQFYIVQNSSVNPMFVHQLEGITGELSGFGEVPDGYFQTMEEVTEMYRRYGGTPHLDWWWEFGLSHIVFGHVVEGMDIVDAIAAVQVRDGGRPLEDVIIQSISFVIYE